MLALVRNPHKVGFRDTEDFALATCSRVMYLGSLDEFGRKALADDLRRIAAELDPSEKEPGA